MAEESDAIALVLRLLHILFGVAWIGALMFQVGVLRRVMPRLDPPARREALRKLIPVVTQYVPGSAVMTILTGAVLFLYLGDLSGDVLLGTEWGRVLLGALVLTVATFGFGMTYVLGAARKIRSHLEEETCGHQAEVGGLQKRFNSGQVIVLLLGLVIIGLMVYAAEVLHHH